MYFHYEKRRNKKRSEYYIGVGLCFGVAFGAAFDNVGLGISLGLVLGIAWQQNVNKKATKKQELPPKNN